MLDDNQSAQTKAERYARNMIYPGGRLYMTRYQDRDVGEIYVAIGKGEVVVDRFGREPCLGELVPTETTLIKDVWRGIWWGTIDGKERGTRINCIAGDWSVDKALDDAIKYGIETLKSMKHDG